jgi:hypothetical protein
MRIVHLLRQHGAWVFIRGLLPILIALLITSTSLAATPSQAGVSWDYKLLGKLNSSQDPVTGLTIRFTGSGSFDLSAGSIGGGGSYTILDAGGSVVGSGTWTARILESFTPLVPGHSPGEGGHLELESLFDGTGTGALNGLNHVVVQCSMWGLQVGPPGYPWPADFVEIGSYTIHKTGAVMFNLNQ